MAQASKRKPERPWRSRQWGRTDTEEVLAQAFSTEIAPPAETAPPAAIVPPAIMVPPHLTVPDTVASLGEQPGETESNIYLRKTDTLPSAVPAPPVTAASPAFTAPPAVSPPPVLEALPASTVSPVSAVPDASVFQGEQQGETKLSVGLQKVDIAPPAVTASPGMGAPPVIARAPDVLAKPKRLKKAHKCESAQHGHSVTDQAVYQFLWGKGSPENPDQPHGNRIISIGVTQIARQIGTIHERNIPIILKRLEGKQSLEVLTREVSDEGTPRQYRVFGYDEIKTRRIRLGLTHVIRSSRGVDFVDPHTLEPIYLQSAKKRQTAPPAVSATPAVVTSPLVRSPVPVVSPESPDVTAGLPPAVSAPLLRKESKESYKEPTTTNETAPPAVWEGFTRLVPEMDEGAMNQIWRDSRSIVPDLTPEELLYFFEARARLLYLNAKVKNPIGLLMKSISDWMTPRKVTARREQLRQDAEEGERIRKQLEQDLA